jgi:NAD(P)H dehydrogenase (quinone)
MLTVTAATGHLGRLVVLGLLDAGVPAAEVVAVVRDPAKAADLADRGVQVRVADYDDAAALTEALADSTRVLLISGTEIGRRVEQHANVLQAAKAAGVELVAYTSGPKVEDSELAVAPDHLATERLVADFGLPGAFLRNNWYLENYDRTIASAAATGEIVGSADGGRIAAATRADLAAGAVAVLTAPEPAPGVYELGGDEAWTLADLAAAVAEVTGKDVVYRDLAADEHVRTLEAAGLPAGAVQFLVGTDQAIAKGALETGSRQLTELIGRPTTTLAEHVRTVLAV